jgi:uncharacterized protein (TIGR02001 family)
MKIINSVVAAVLIPLACSPVIALELGGGFDASANVGVVSNYMWRGMSQTRNGAALQGGVDLAHSSGFYTGAWFSNVDFKLADDAETEQDVYVGYGFTLSDFAFDLKYTDYHYASVPALNFDETHAQVSAYGFAIGADYSDNTPVYGLSTGTIDASAAFNYYGSYTYTLTESGMLEGVSLTASMGQYDYKDAGWVGASDSKYTYYNIGANKTMWDINFGVAFTGSNVDGDNCRVFAGGSDYCGDVFLVSAVKTFK